MNKPERRLLWYGRLTMWEGERALVSADGVLIILRWQEWLDRGYEPEDLVVCGFGEERPAFAGMEVATR